jgi:YbbR domain-containing protein
MNFAPLRWLLKNLSTLLLAFVLAVIVWVSAVWAADPNETHVLARSIPIEFIGQSPTLQIFGNPQTNVTLTLNAPSSVWRTLNNDLESVRAWVDLTNLESGEYSLPVQIQIVPRLVRVVTQVPEDITVQLEPLITASFPVVLELSGLPPTGYEANRAVTDPEEVLVTGPQSLVSNVKEARLVLDITGKTETVDTTLQPTLVDAQGRPIDDLVVTPESVHVTVPIDLLGGYRYVIIRPVTVGLVANGYRLSNIYITPPGLVVFSSDPQLLEDLPGYVETKDIDLTNANDDFETLVELDLPEGVSAVGDPKVLIQVSIAAIESSLAVSVPVEAIGLIPGLQATVTPVVVDVILSGPVPLLNGLEPSDIRVKVDLTGFAEGNYQLLPVVDFLPEGVSIVSILPSTIDVTVSKAPTPTITPTPGGTVTPAASPTPSTKSSP